MEHVTEPKYYVTRVTWTEYERGWGQRFDGYSYHINRDHAEKYTKEFIAGMPNTAPECYVSPGMPRIVQVNPVFAMLVYYKEILWDDNDHEIVNDNF